MVITWRNTGNRTELNKVTDEELDTALAQYASFDKGLDFKSLADVAKIIKGERAVNKYNWKWFIYGFLSALTAGFMLLLFNKYII